MASLSTAILSLRRDRRILKLPPYLSVVLIVVGVVWLFMLPLNEYSRQTYVSENALLPGQVHTYFGGSEHNVFRAYRQEVAALAEAPVDERVQRLEEIFRSSGLKVATQSFEYKAAGTTVQGKNVYALLQGPRADATEAIVLIGAWRNMDNVLNQSGVALVLTLARYFKRWSLWSKDIIFVITEDSVAGPQAWVDAYHDSHDPQFVSSLPIKSGALQGAVALDYPAGIWGHRFDKLHVVYDGINGQLPNLDLFNTAVSIASGQMGIGCTLQRMWDHNDSYKERLQTMLRGMLNQGLGHATGPHSGFIPYHVDAITLQTVGDGWHDEMSLGRTVEGLFRSLNNLLEHLHQSFFLYLLLHANRFVSIGTYLPSAMLIAGSFTVMSIALWIKSGRPPTNSDAPSSEKAPKPSQPTKSSKLKNQTFTAVKSGSATVLIPDALLTITERHMFFPLASLTAISFLGLVPFYLFNRTPLPLLAPAYQIFTIATLPAPHILAFLTPRLLHRRPTSQELTLLHCFSLLLLGMYLSALATLNFSLSTLIGVLSTPFSFIPSARAPGATLSRREKARALVWSVLIALLSPTNVIWAATVALEVDGGLGEVLRRASFGWWVNGLWTSVVVWLIWWPAWFVASFIVGSGIW
ncbi:Glycosylphosphatidylinositol:protein transamidase, GAA1 component [Trichodelitschia bisporula]|uniref:Glycosylphosphatidylinositol:protein transamidase, GAA1 component n=1 Tax=Trichodelitschia bisporula TaxID=703511 RepID=A0A6G1HV26_9PEZI|nr:Glycosylphosphatidylinositol:protein transamidase, GAA1 component [Trichodelitschia bisporula]